MIDGIGMELVAEKSERVFKVTVGEKTVTVTERWSRPDENDGLAEYDIHIPDGFSPEDEEIIRQAISEYIPQ